MRSRGNRRESPTRQDIGIVEAGRDRRPREIDALSNDAGFHADIDNQTHQMTRCPVLRPSRIRTSDGVYVQARYPGEIARVSRFA